MTEAPRSRRLTMDDIEAELTDIARSGEGADKFRALKALMGLKTQEATLPEPLNDSDIKSRLARLMSGAGLMITRLAYFDAFKHRKRTGTIQAELEAMTKLEAGVTFKAYPKSLAAFRKRYPELNRAGFPRGYPQKGSLIAKEAWLKTECDKIELERSQAKIKEAVDHIEGKDGLDQAGARGTTPEPESPTAPETPSEPPGNPL